MPSRHLNIDRAAVGKELRNQAEELREKPVRGETVRG
jgi:hypothetical protein